MIENRNIKVFAALATLYLAWSSTYLAIRFSLESFPPFFTAGFRYMLVGAGMYGYLRIKGDPSPTRRQWRDSSIIGAFLLLGGTGGVVYAMQWVGSGTSALVIATTPLWTVLFGGIWKQWPARNEWIGLALGFAGIVLLNMNGDLRAHPAGAALLVLSAASWSFGSVLSLRLKLPSGMMASAAQMFSGGLLVLLVGMLSNENFPAHPSARAVTALVYLALFGSLLGYSAYTYLLTNVRPALATSYSYVNPALAVLLGVWFADEKITGSTVTAMFIILAGVVLVILGQRK
jgi:drug/metabolite transporter (DMT)-like permease